MEKLLLDEDNLRDLPEQCKINENGAKKIYLEPYKSQLSSDNKPMPVFRSSGSQQHRKNIPRQLLDKRKKETQIASNMGILPEIHRVWVSIDNCLYLWNYLSSTEDFEKAIEMERDDSVLDTGQGNVGSKNKNAAAGGGPSNKASKGNQSQSAGAKAREAVIVSVALCAPKPGVFQSSVKYVLVVATTMHVAVLALKCGPMSASLAGGNVNDDLIAFNPVNPNMPSQAPLDLSQSINDFRTITYLQTEFIIGTDNVLCRKVVGTQTGRIFMCGGDCNLYEMKYDNTYNSWAALKGSLEPEASCSKVLHSGWNFSWNASNLIPPMLKGGGLMGLCMSDIAVDDVRNVLYTADSEGNISVMYLGPDGDEATYVCHTFNIFENCKQYLSSGSDKQSPNPSLFQSENVLKHSLKIVSINIVPLTESRKVHAVVVLSNGVRVYLTLKNRNSSVYLDTIQLADREKQFQADNYEHWETNSLKLLPNQTSSVPFVPSIFSTKGPSKLSIAFIRSPPKRDCIDSMLSNQQYNGSGIFPSVDASDGLKVNAALYNQGMFVLASDPSQLLRSQKKEQIVALCDDTWSRDISKSTSYTSSLRESISVIEMEENSTIHDMKEDCLALNYTVPSQLLSLTSVSYTPSINKINNWDGVHSSGVYSKTYDIDACPSEVPALPGPCIAPSGRGISLGIPRNALDQIPFLSEHTTQHIPSSAHSLQRRVLVLESDQLRILQKWRPVDFLYDTIKSNLNDNNKLENGLLLISNGYGPENYCAMCIGIACGIPCDAGGNPGMHAAVGAGEDRVKDRALQYLKLPGLTTSSPYIKANLDQEIRYYNKDLTEDEVQVSCVLSGFRIFMGRLLRPIWLKSIAVIERRNGKKQSVPAQFLSPELLRSIIRPLQQLKDVMLRQDQYHSVILRNNRFSTAPDGSTGSGLGGINPEKYCQNAGYTGMTNDALKNQLAREYEDLCICQFYRLLKRIIQSLHLLETLLIADTQWKLPVQNVWKAFTTNNEGKMDPMNLRLLAASASRHDIVKAALRQLILDSAEQEKLFTKKSKSITIQSNLIDNLIYKLKNDCYMYYSVHDAKWHEAEEGLADLERMLSVSLSIVSTEIQQKASTTIQLLIDAAEHWYLLDLVHSDDISKPTELEKKCKQLMKLGKIGRNGVPELCMAALRNFSSNNSDFLQTKNVAITGQIAYQHNYAMQIAPTGDLDDKDTDDRALYHGATTLSTDDKKLGRESIFKTLVDCILSVKTQSVDASGAPMDAQTTERFMLDMAQDSINYLNTSSTQSDEFMGYLCKRLYDDKRTEILLQLQHPYVERFLQENDTDLLFRWFNIHGYHSEATRLMYKKATSSSKSDGNVQSIEKRIEFFRMAWRSASVANTPNKYDYQVALHIAEAWQVAVYGFENFYHEIKDMSSFLKEKGYENSESHKASHKAYVSYIDEFDKEQTIDKFRSTFISEDIYGSIGKDMDALRNAHNSSEAKEMEYRLDSLYLLEEKLHFLKALQVPASDIEIDKLWSSIIFK
jgi:hypothetical protein